MRMRTHVALVFLVLAVLPRLAAAQIPQELREAMRQRDEAAARGDAAAWRALTMDGFTIVHADGSIAGRGQQATQLGDVRLVATGTEPLDEQLQRIGDTVIRRSFDGRAWTLEVWALADGAWRVATTQVTPVTTRYLRLRVF